MRLLEEALVVGAPADLGKSVLLHSGRYGALVMKLVVENEHLRGRLDVYDSEVVNG